MGLKGELLRQRIVAAADQLFYQQGFENTSFNDIASAVEISRGNFYYHFKSKDEILQAVINNRSADIKQILDNWDQQHNDPKLGIIHYIDILTTMQENIANSGCPIGGICSELAKIDHAMQDDANQLYTLFIDWLTIKFKQLGHSKNARQLAMHLLARSQGIASVTNSFGDKAFLKYEVKLLKQWLDDITG